MSLLQTWMALATLKTPDGLRPAAGFDDTLLRCSTKPWPSSESGCTRSTTRASRWCGVRRSVCWAWCCAGWATTWHCWSWACPSSRTCADHFCCPTVTGARCGAAWWRPSCQECARQEAAEPQYLSECLRVAKTSSARRLCLTMVAPERLCQRPQDTRFASVWLILPASR